MKYEYVAIPDREVPQAADPLFQHVVATYASETNKTISMWRVVPDNVLDFKPQEKTNTIRTIMVHQILSERRFFAQFVGTEEPPVEELLPEGEKPLTLRPISKSTSGWRKGDCRNSPRRRRVVAEPGRSSVGSNENEYGCSGGGCFILVTIEPRCSMASLGRADSFLRSTGLPET